MSKRSLDFIHAKYCGRFQGIVRCIGDLPAKQLLDSLVEVSTDLDKEVAEWEAERRGVVAGETRSA